MGHKYKAYPFSEQDPILELLRVTHRSSEMKISQLAKESTVCQTTIRNWFSKKTKSPKFATAASVAVALGMKELPITAEARRKFRG